MSPDDLDALTGAIDTSANPSAQEIQRLRAQLATAEAQRDSLLAALESIIARCGRDTPMHYGSLVEALAAIAACRPEGKAHGA